MPLSRTRDYRSIGEVLDALREDFPDVTISKIRFLESAGLIVPERTGAGYRKFYEGDLARLRYILALQRDHFLPLKVIRERLDEVDLDGGAPPAPASGPAPERVPAGRATVTEAVATGVQMTRAELLAASGLAEEQLAGLEEFGIVEVPATDAYDENHLTVATVAGAFFDLGVEARHLKMYKQAADREAAFFEQIVAPMARRRDPAAQEHAVRSMEELVGLSRRIREAVLRATLQGQL